jgi:hypothetical protein
MEASMSIYQQTCFGKVASFAKVAGVGAVAFFLCLSAATNAQTKTISDIVEEHRGATAESANFNAMAQQVIARVAAFNPRVLSQDAQSRPTKMESGGTIFEFAYDANGKIDFTKVNGEMLRQRVSTDLEGNLVLRNFLEDWTELDPLVLAKKNSARYVSLSEEYRALYSAMEPIDLAAFEALKKIRLEEGYAKALKAHRAKANNPDSAASRDGQIKIGGLDELTPQPNCLPKCELDHANTVNACQTVADLGSLSCEPLGPIVGAACKAPFVLERGRCIERANKQRYDCQIRCG